MFRHSRLAIFAVLLAAAGSALAAPRPLIAAKSRIDFSVKEMGVSVSGQFRKFDAKIDLDPARPENSTAEVSVDIASLTTGDNDADAIAVDKPWLNKIEFPKASFKSTSVKGLAANRYEVRGTLTIRGKSREIVVPLATEPQADGTLKASGAFSVKRSDFAIGGGEWNEGDVVADDVPVKFALTLGAAAP
ncbi:YceI family protein [Solimonas soli]|uniref:YceI family protein n=1 Tax=Solimonas soli TaxID=413479 RepID=UPI0004AFB20A|nr:YceI family protein [Solimonas soli]